jgi:hypothetical protein
MTFDCPRCAGRVDEAFYGPCTSCRTELASNHLDIAQGSIEWCRRSVRALREMARTHVSRGPGDHFVSECDARARELLGTIRRLKQEAAA